MKTLLINGRERKSFLNFAGEERRKKSSFEDTR
jgi:hypothetical protein